MKSNGVSIQGTKTVYVRMPSNVKDMEVMKLFLSEECANKTIMIAVIDNADAPFDKDAVFERTAKGNLTYHGSRDYWNPETVRRTIVEGHPECDFTECVAECHDVSCDVQIGYAPCNPVNITYLRSDKVK